MLVTPQPVSHHIITAAREYIGVPFRHQGRCKRTGVDCLGLIVAIAQELELCDASGRLLAEFDETDYAHLPDERRLYKGLARVLTPVGADTISAGDIALFRIDGGARHVGVIGDNTLIHAYAPARKVVEHGLSREWRDKMAGGFRFIRDRHV